MIATFEDAKKGLDKVCEWVCEHEWNYDDCPNLFDGIDLIESYMTKQSVEECHYNWGFDDPAFGEDDDFPFEDDFDEEEVNELEYLRNKELKGALDKDELRRMEELSEKYDY